MTTVSTQTDRIPPQWDGFIGGPWQDQVNVRDFIQRNFTPYTGDDSFLAGATERTSALWGKLTAMFPQEREKGVYDIDYSTISGIDAYEPGYIDKDNELIVGLQTDAPLKRAIMPYGGWRMVEESLETYGYPVLPVLREIFTKYRKTHNQAVFDAYTRRHPRRPIQPHHHRPAGRLRSRPDHRRLPADRAVRRRRPHRCQEDRAPRARRPALDRVRSSGSGRRTRSRSGRCRN